MDNKVLVHKHLIIRAEAYNPPMEEEYLKWWFEKFIKEIGMKVMMGPYVKYSNMVGNRGITGESDPANSYSLDDFSDDVVEIATQIGSHEIKGIFGHSLGGMVAINLLGRKSIFCIWTANIQMQQRNHKADITKKLSQTT